MSLPSAIRRRNPVQSRAEATLRAIREAGLKILEQKGAARLTTNHIAEVAGVSIGSVYQYYPDKYAIVADICNELLVAEVGQFNHLVERSLRYARKSLDEIVNFIVQENLARHRKLYQFLKEYYLEIHWQYDFEAYVVKTYPETHVPTAEWLSYLFKRHGDALQIDDCDRAAEMIADVIQGTIHATLQRRPQRIFDDRYGDDLVTLVLRYLKDSDVCRGPAGVMHGSPASSNGSAEMSSADAKKGVAA